MGVNSNRDIQDLKKRHQAELDDTRNAVKSYGKTDEDIALLKQDFDEKMKAKEEAFRKEKDELKAERKLQVRWANARAAESRALLNLTMPPGS